MARRMETLQDFAEAARRARRPGELWHYSRVFSRANGFPRLSYHYTAPFDPGDEDARIIASGFPDDWVRTYVERKLHRVDPIPTVAQTTGVPFRWREVGRLKQLTDAERGYLAEFDRAGIGDGYAIQTYGPKMRNGYVGVGFGPRSRPVDAGTVMMLQAAGQIAHLAYCQMLDRALANRIGLSPREREILEWIARGKSNAAIAGILGISAHTIDAHMRKIFAKLGVADRVSAAIRGIGLGAIAMPA